MNGASVRQKGFTLIELLLVIGIMGILSTIATISLLRTQHTASVSATVDELVADLRLQQTKAMTGAKDTTGNQNSYGIHFTGSGYILFQGASDPANTTDFTVTPTSITFTTNLPSSSLVFAERSGEFLNYVNGTTYTITVKNANGNEQKVLTVNKYGIITGIQ